MWTDALLHHNKQHQLALCWQRTCSAVDLHVPTSCDCREIYDTCSHKVSGGCCPLVICIQVLCWSSSMCYEANVFYMNVKTGRGKEVFSLRPPGKFWDAPLLYIYILLWKFSDNTAHKLLTHTHTGAQLVCLLILLNFPYYKNITRLIVRTYLEMKCFILIWKISE